MSRPPITFLTSEEYLEIEEKNEFRSEFVNGEMFAMAETGEAVATTARPALRG